MALHIDKLSKRYPNGTQALADVSLDIQNGMFGLLGPNGAGKSTLMRTLATLQEADAGSARLDDIDVLHDKARLRACLGYLPQEFGIYPLVSARELLMHFAALKGIGPHKARRQAVDQLLERTNLAHVAHHALGSFSGGMKQRFGIAQALLGSPRLIIVDEPTAGLDPEERVRFHNLLSEIGEDIVVVLSTHIVSDVRDLCANMAVLLGGRVVLSGQPEALVQGLKGRIWQRLVPRPEAQAHAGTALSMQLRAGRTLVRVLAEAAPDGFLPAEPDLEDVYFAAMKPALGAA